MPRKSGSEQLPLEFPLEEQTSRDDLAVTTAMQAAVRIVDGWPHWPSPVVVLVGPAGCGKSHLASIWRDISGARDIVPEEDNGASETAAKGPVLFEDADRTAFSEVELFHVINAVRSHGTALLMTARTFPANWPVELADLRSRLKAVTVVEIGEPDQELLVQVLMKLFSDRQLAVDEKLIAYIAERMERSTEAARAVVDTLDRLALARRTKINRALAAEVLDQMQVTRESD